MSFKIMNHHHKLFVICAVVVVASIFPLSFADDHKHAPEKAKHREFLRKSEIFKSAKKIWKQLKNVNLTRREPVEIGHITEIEVSKGHILLLRTMSLQPPIFEIEDFLTEKECDHILSIAKENELEVSKTYADHSSDQVFLSTSFPCDPFAYNFSRWDVNKDGVLNASEGATALSASLDIFVTPPVFKSIIRDSWWDFDQDGMLSQHEFHRVNASRLNETVAFLKIAAPQYKSRHSKQTWIELDKDNIISNITSRVTAVTGLPGDIVKSSEALQVVHYGNQGHYNCHMDTNEGHLDQMKCCHNKMPMNESEEEVTYNCIPCRYATLLYFLNEVEHGGETAFPFADDAVIDEESSDLHGDSRLNLEVSCDKANVVVKPKKGKAILWYNNLINSTSQWMGKPDVRSYHGGCHVLRGEKWVANNWINVSPFKMKDAVSIAKSKANKTEVESVLKQHHQMKLEQEQQKKKK